MAREGDKVAFSFHPHFRLELALWLINIINYQIVHLINLNHKIFSGF